MLEIFLLYILYKFENLINFKNEDSKSFENLNKNLTINNENYKDNIITGKINSIYEGLKKIQIYFSEKIASWSKAISLKNNKNANEPIETTDNEMQMITIKNYYQEISNISKKVIFHFENYFKIIEKNCIKYNNQLDNIIHDHNLFEELKLDPITFFEETPQSIKNLFSKINQQIQNNNEKTLIVYHNKCFKHCDFSNFDPLTRINKRNYLVENPDRLNILFQPPFGIFLSDFFLKKNFGFLDQSKLGVLADIVRIHDFEYVMKIKNLCEKAVNVGNDRILKYGKFFDKSI